MKRIFVIYDDSKMPGKEIKTITGAKSYGETIFKRVTLKDRMEAEIVKEPCHCEPVLTLAWQSP